MNVSRIRPVAIAGLLVLSIVQPAPIQAADPYLIDMILSQTGPAAVAGVPTGKGMKVVEDMVNASGGINGRPVKIVISDDQSSPQVAVQLASALIAKHVPVILGPMSTASCSAVAALTDKTGPVTYCVTPFVEPQPGSFVFAGGPTTADAVTVVLRYYRERGITRFAMLNATDGSGQALDKAFDQAFLKPENKNLTIVAHQHFSPADTSTSAEIAQIKAANPQVLITWMIGAPFGTVLRGMHDGGLDIPVVTNGANMSAAYMTQLASFLPKEVDFAAYASYPQVAMTRGIAGAQAAQNRAFEADHSKPEGNAIGAWDLTLVVIDALRHLPANPTGEQVRSYIEKLHDFAGTNAMYDFRKYPQRGLGPDGQVIARYNAATNDFVPISKPGGGK